MSHISENDVEDLVDYFMICQRQAAGVDFERGKKIVSSIRANKPAPQSDEVRMAWQYVDAFVSCSKKNNNHDAAVHKEITDALTLIRADQMPDEIYVRAEAHGNDWCITPEFGVRYVRADHVERLMKNSVDVLALHDQLTAAYDELGVMYDNLKSEYDALRDGEQSERTEWKGQPEL